MATNDPGHRPCSPVGLPPACPGEPRKVNPGEIAGLVLFPVWAGSGPASEILAARKPNYLLRAHAGSFRRVWVQSGAGRPLYGLVETPRGPVPMLMAGALRRMAAGARPAMDAGRLLDLFVSRAAAAFEAAAEAQEK